MTAKVVRVRPKRLDVITDALQLALDLPSLRPETRDDLAEVLGRLQPAERWGYVMLNPQQQLAVLHAINNGPKPAITLRVWNAAIAHLRYDDAEIMAGRERLAVDAATTPAEVSRALSRLVEIGAVIRLRPGRFKVNQHVAHAGSMQRREAAAKSERPVPAPQLALVQPAK
ncbi:MAG: hypothetical protein ACK51V_02380 [bacterium]|jgi:hypothetical protein